MGGEASGGHKREEREKGLVGAEQGELRNKATEGSWKDWKERAVLRG